ncbi:MAG: type II restriction endonuclease, partial [Firmicutes bacterium]|nr:type II restriction endonuclease [Bacillota bacterium]
SVFVRQNASVCKFGVDSWVVLSPIEQRIKAKIEAVGTPLKDWDINIYRGVLTGYNEAFIIDGKKKDELIAEDPKSAEIIRPILRGRDIKRYGYDFADLWLINTHNGIKEKGIKPININDYPAIKSHLDKYFPELEKRQDKGDTPYNLRNCAYIEDFCKQKIAWASVGETFYSLVPENTFLLDTNYFLTSNQHTKYLLAVLNSKLITYWINSEDTQIGSGGAYRHYKYNLEKLNIIKPIAKIEQKIEILLQCSDYCAIDLLVYELYGLDKDEIEFIKFL